MLIIWDLCGGREKPGDVSYHVFLWSDPFDLFRDFLDLFLGFQQTGDLVLEWELLLLFSDFLRSLSFFLSFYCWKKSMRVETRCLFYLLIDSHLIECCPFSSVKAISNNRCFDRDFYLKCDICAFACSRLLPSILIVVRCFFSFPFNLWDRSMCSYVWECRWAVLSSTSFSVSRCFYFNSQ